MRDGFQEPAEDAEAQERPARAQVQVRVLDGRVPAKVQDQGSTQAAHSRKSFQPELLLLLPFFTQANK